MQSSTQSGTKRTKSDAEHPLNLLCRSRLGSSDCILTQSFATWTAPLRPHLATQPRPITNCPKSVLLYTTFCAVRPSYLRSHSSAPTSCMNVSWRMVCAEADAQYSTRETSNPAERICRVSSPVPLRWHASFFTGSYVMRKNWQLASILVAFLYAL